MAEETVNETVTDALTASGLIDGIDEWRSLGLGHREHPEGHVLCRTGDPADCVWVVVTGCVAVRTGGKTIVTRGRGEVVGEQGVVDQAGVRTTDLVVANGPAHVVHIAKAAIEAHSEQARLWRNCAAIISNKLSTSTEQRSAMREELYDKTEFLRRHVGEDALSHHALMPPELSDTPRRERAVIWFSDVVGFSKFALEMAPDRTASLVQQFLTPQVTGIAGRGGYIDKFMGDGVMAYWLVRSHTGEQECLAALEAARDALAKVGEIAIGPSPLTLRIGLHVGEVAAGNFGTPMRVQYTLIGPEVNKAARLEQAKEGASRDALGAIRVSSEFYDALPTGARDWLPVKVSIEAKNMGSFEVFSSAVEGV